MNTRKYSRTMAEAFGPYTSNSLEPMQEADSASFNTIAKALEAALKLIELVMPIDGDVTREARAAIAKATGSEA